MNLALALNRHSKRLWRPSTQPRRAAAHLDHSDVIAELDLGWHADNHPAISFERDRRLVLIADGLRLGGVGDRLQLRAPQRRESISWPTFVLFLAAVGSTAALHGARRRHPRKTPREPQARQQVVGLRSLL